MSPGWLWVRPRDDRRGGRGFREKGIWITTSGFWAGGIQRGLEGRAGVLGTHFLSFFLLLIGTQWRRIGLTPGLSPRWIRAVRKAVCGVRFRHSLNRPYAK